VKNDKYDLPDSLYDFAQISDYPKVIARLSSIVETEDWVFQKTRFPAPYNTMPDFNLKIYIDGCILASMWKKKS